MLIPAGVPVNFVAVFESANPADVAMSVYDASGNGAPVLLLSPVAMSHVVASTFSGKFTPAAGKTYVVVMAVYTDNTFASLDPSFVEQSMAAVAQYLTPPSQDLIGVVEACCP